LTRKSIYYVVDDDLDDQQFLIEALTKNDPDSQCYSADNGSQAINNLKNAIVPVPDVIFLDLNMPHQNGKQCLAELKHTSTLKDIPVVIYSTTSNKSEIQDTLRLGAAHFMIKKSSFKGLQEELSLITASLNKADSVK
jgi:CheY-like chemotaxis protein